MINATAIQPQPADSSTGSTSSGLPTSQGLDSMFLQLLVAQLQNQDPTSPLDPSQFVGQLAQFSELSEVTQIDQILQQALPGTAGTGSSISNAPVSNASTAAGIAANASPGIAANSSAGPGMPPTRILPPTLSDFQTAAANSTSSGSSFLRHRIEGVF